MKASAPGKLVLSGAYAVLRGAPSLVTAVNRRVSADDQKPALFQAPEVLAGISLLFEDPKAARIEPPWFDAAPLRANDRKLGLGSSAAICVASLALALIFKNESEGRPWTPCSIVHELYPLALRAHKQAQGGGSGVDVAAACFGGHLKAQTERSPNDESDRLSVNPVRFPSDLVVETWACPSAASTAHFVKSVFALEARNPRLFERTFGAQMTASHLALEKLEASDSPRFVRALTQQFDALSALGDAAEVPIVLPAVRRLAASLPENCCFLPSGAGGGDVTLYVGATPSPPSFRNAAEEMQMTLVSLELGAPGLEISDPDKG